MAQGGIQIPNDSDKDRTAMIEDMLKSSRGLALPCRPTNGGEGLPR